VKKSIADKWVKALKSGKYKQSRGKLRGPRGYCCLGVLCDLKNPKGWVDEREEFEGCGGQADYTFMADGNYPEDNTLPLKVMSWAGMKSADGEFGDDESPAGHRQTLVTLNDHRHWGFKEIAKFIQKNYKKL